MEEKIIMNKPKNIKSKTIKFYFLIMLMISAIFILVMQTGKFIMADEETGNQLSDPRIENWYKIQDWELEVCRKFGGLDSVQNNANVENQLFLYQTTFTLQAKKEKAENKIMVYKISYYVNPIENARFSIRLFDSIYGKKELLIEPIVLNNKTNDIGFISFVENSNENFDVAQMALGDNSKIFYILSVPIIESLQSECEMCGIKSATGKNSEWGGWK